MSAPKKHIPIEMPLERARELSASFRAQSQNMAQATEEERPPLSPNVVVDAVSLGGPVDGKSKPLVRHVIIKDLYKIGTRLGFKFPRNGVFANRASIGLCALFDGQSSAGPPGPSAAEFCARGFHTKLLEMLRELPDAAEPNAVAGALKSAVEDLDTDMVLNHPEINDGCGAAVALLIGNHVFTALLGRCNAVICGVQGTAASGIWSFSENDSKAALSHDVGRLRQVAPDLLVEDGLSVKITHPVGQVSEVTRSLGDRIWKDSSSVQRPLVVSSPEVRFHALQDPEHNPFFLLVASSVTLGFGPQELIDVSKQFPLQPRAACGQIAIQALGASATQCTVVQLSFLPTDQRRPATGVGQPPPAKKAKVPGSAGATGIESMRLRHILVKCSEINPAAKDASAKQQKPLRTRQEAETILRKAILDLRKEIQSFKKTPKDATELVSMMTKKFCEVCKEISECETARKGGNLCGELGWLTPEERGMHGAGFKEAVDILTPGQLSDIATSTYGLHLVQRVA